MANVVKTVMTYQLNGSTRDFNIPFEYLARKFVQVTLLGLDRKVLTLNTDFRFSTKTTITTTQAWGSAQGYDQIEIRRHTSATERLVDFTDGSILRAYDLNVAQIQTMHVAEEARDLTADTIGVNNEGHLDARNRRIVNLANAVNDRDAVPFGQLKTMNQNAWDSMNKAQAFRNEAQTFRNQAESFKNETNTLKAQAAASQAAAKTSETNAKASENAANASKGAAATSASAAKTSETNAANSANSSKASSDLAQKWANNPRNQVVASNEYSAKHYAEVAKEESAKLANWNALAGTIDSVSGDNITFKGAVGALKGFVSAYADGLRIRQAGNSVIHRYDGANYYMLFSDTVDGSWNAKRPLSINFATGVVSHAHGLNVSGGDISNTNRYASSYSYGGAYAAQLNTSAAFFQQLPGNQDGNTYYPIVKQYGRRSNGYPTAFHMGMVSAGTNAFHRGVISLNGDNNNNSNWYFSMGGQFGTKGLHSSAQIQSVGNGANYLCQTAGNVEDQACYMLGQAGGNNWYIGKGGATNDVTFHSYKHNTTMNLRAGDMLVNKTIISASELRAGSGSARLATDGNVHGSVWGSNAKAYIDSHKGVMSKAVNGYWKDPTTGLIIQWGRITHSNSGAVTVTFPIAFPAAVYNVQTTTERSGKVGDDHGYIRNVTRTNFVAGFEGVATWWMAIGY